MSSSSTITASVVLTFDNLGEAAEMQRGEWPAGRAVGRHPSVTKALPRLLETLGRLELRATFFLEAINCELNPEAVRSIAEHGHEVGIHGWRHESWGELDRAREQALLERSRAAFADIGVDARAFRPPGGAINARTPGLLREIGCRWVSPLGTTAHVDDGGFGWVPFAWELVDAYYLMESFGPLRTRSGDSETSLAPAEAAARLRSGLLDSAAARTPILHPFLLADDAWWAEAASLLGELAELQRAGELTITTGGELTQHLGAQR